MESILNGMTTSDTRLVNTGVAMVWGWWLHLAWQLQIKHSLSFFISRVYHSYFCHGMNGGKWAHWGSGVWHNWYSLIKWFDLWPGFQQCNMNIKFLTEYKYEYIRKRKYHRMRMSNIFISRQLTEYEYWIYSCLATWPNKNIEYICF